MDARHHPHPCGIEEKIPSLVVNHGYGIEIRQRYDVIKDFHAPQKSRLGIDDKESRAKNNFLTQSMSSKRFDCETSSGTSAALTSDIRSEQKSDDNKRDVCSSTGSKRGNNKDGEKPRKRTDGSVLGNNKNFGSAKADTERPFVPHLAFRLDGKRSKNKNSAPSPPPAPMTRAPRIKTETSALTSSSSSSDSRSQSVQELRDLLLKESSLRTQGNNSRGRSYSQAAIRAPSPPKATPMLPYGYHHQHQHHHDHSHGHAYQDRDRTRDANQHQEYQNPPHDRYNAIKIEPNDDLDARKEPSAVIRHSPDGMMMYMELRHLRNKVHGSDAPRSGRQSVAFESPPSSQAHAFSCLSSRSSSQQSQSSPLLSSFLASPPLSPPDVHHRRRHIKSKKETSDKRAPEARGSTIVDGSTNGKADCIGSIENTPDNFMANIDHSNVVGVNLNKSDYSDAGADDNASSHRGGIKDDFDFSDTINKDASKNDLDFVDGGDDDDDFVLVPDSQSQESPNRNPLASFFEGEYISDSDKDENECETKEEEAATRARNEEELGKKPVQCDGENDQQWDGEFDGKRAREHENTEQCKFKNAECTNNQDGTLVAADDVSLLTKRNTSDRGSDNSAIDANAETSSRTLPESFDLKQYSTEFANALRVVLKFDDHNNVSDTGYKNTSANNDTGSNGDTNGDASIDHNNSARDNAKRGNDDANAAAAAVAATNDKNGSSKDITNGDNDVADVDPENPVVTRCSEKDGGSTKQRDQTNAIVSAEPQCGEQRRRFTTNWEPELNRRAQFELERQRQAELEQEQRRKRAREADDKRRQERIEWEDSLKSNPSALRAALFGDGSRGIGSIGGDANNCDIGRTNTSLGGDKSINRRLSFAESIGRRGSAFSLPRSPGPSSQSAQSWLHSQPSSSLSSLSPVGLVFPTITTLSLTGNRWGFDPSDFKVVMKTTSEAMSAVESKFFGSVEPTNVIDVTNNKRNRIDTASGVDKSGKNGAGNNNDGANTLLNHRASCPPAATRADVRSPRGDASSGFQHASAVSLPNEFASSSSSSSSSSASASASSSSTPPTPPFDYSVFLSHAKNAQYQLRTKRLKSDT